MRKFLKSLLVILILVSVIIGINCAVNPVTGKKEIMLVSKNMELEMGREIDRGLRLEYGLYQDKGLRDYVSAIGHKLAPYTHRPELQYHFAILDTPVENAFAAPGGYIYITRGLMCMINSEAELAAVLGHELGHVNARHSARQMTRSILITLGILLIGELDEDLKKITPISLIAAQLLFLKYSRSDEYQADALGYEYSTKAGYAGGELVSFFQSLNRLTNIQGGSHLPNFLSTHPMTPKRIDKIKERLQMDSTNRPEDQPPLLVSRNDYLRKTNGLVFGDDPRQGYVENNTFYHTSMGFSFRIPHGWKYTNTPLQVTMSSPDGNAVMVLKAETTTESLEKYAQNSLESLSNPRLENESYRYINGLNAFHKYVSIPPEVDENGEPVDGKEDINVRVSCIRKGDTIFTFFSAASESNFSTYGNTVDRTVNSFQKLSGISRFFNRRSPKRIQIRQVKRPQTLQQFLKRLSIPQQSFQKIALINNMEIQQRLSSGQLVKIIQ